MSIDCNRSDRALEIVVASITIRNFDDDIKQSLPAREPMRGLPEFGKGRLGAAPQAVPTTPPSQAIVWPTTYSPAREQRKMASPAISWAVPTRPLGLDSPT
jgi:hypothetical protein